jgi:signal transduction histidine kinase
MTLLEPAPPRVPGFGGLSRAARTALGSEAVIVVREGDGATPELVDHHGLEPSALPTVRRGVASGDPDFLAREFAGVLSAPIALDGERLGTIHALRRDPRGDFARAELLETFAVQAAIALGMARRPAMRRDGAEVLAGLDELVVSVHDLEGLSHAVTDALGPLFGGALTAVMVVDQQRNILQMSPGAFGAPGEVAASHQVNLFDPASNSARVFTTGQPYISNASPTDPGIRQSYVDAFGIRRLMSVPLHRIGVLHIANKPTAFDLDDLELALTLAPRVATIVELATTLLRLRRQQRLEGILADVAVAVASGSPEQSFLVPALEELCAATDANLLAIVPEDAPSIVARRGALPGDHEATVLEEAGSNPGVRAYVVGPRRAGDPGHAAFYVPVRLGHQRVGTLAAFRNRGEPFAQAERRSLMRMANLAALARATERYQRQSTELARLHERQRIADDLHDDVAQILFAAQLSLDAILQRGGIDEPTADAIARSRGLLIRGDTAIRTVIHRLSSAPAADIATRLSSVIANVEDEFDLPVALTVAEDAALVARHLSRPKSDALVKVAREALVNAAKHAGPCDATMTLERSARDRLVLTVADDGRGVAGDDGAPHHGLSSLRRVVAEQGGTLSVARGPAGGTLVTAGLPLEPVGDDER